MSKEVIKSMQKHASTYIDACVCHINAPVSSKNMAACFYCVLSGKIEVRDMEGMSHILLEEDLLYIRPDVEFFMAPNEPSVLLILGFHPCFLLENIGFSWEQIPCFPKSPEDNTLSMITAMASLAILPEAQTEHLSSYMYAKAYEFLHQLEIGFLHAESDAMTTQPSKTEAVLCAIQEYLRIHCHEAVSLSEAAGAFGYAPTYLAGFLKKNLSMTFQTYLTKLRCRSARLYLELTEDSMTKIAADCGFPNLLAMNKAFVQECGMAPETIRSSRSHPFSFDQHKNIKRITVQSRKKNYLMKYAGYRQKAPSFLKAAPSCGSSFSMKSGVPLCLRWNELINLGSIVDFELSTFRKQITFLQKEFHFRFGRFLGLPYLIRSHTIDGCKVYDFSKIFQVIDYLNDIHLIPWIELGKKPFNLDRFDRRSATEYEVMSSDTAYECRLQNMLPELLRELINRYGFDQVSLWRFELWQDIPVNPAPLESYAAYSQHFRKTAEIIKEYLPEALVGGPGFHTYAFGDDLESAIGRYIDLAYPPDFYTALYFPVRNNPQGECFGADRNTTYRLIPDSGDMYKRLKELRHLLDRHGKTDIPLYVTEYNAYPFEGNHLNDSIYPAVYMITQTLRQQEYAEACAWWLATDISLEYQNPVLPFFGGSGLLSKDGVPKPSWHAFTMLRELKPILAGQDDHCIVTRDEDGSLTILVHNINQLDPEFVNAPSSPDLLFYPYLPYAKQLPLEFCIHIQDIKPCTYVITKITLSLSSGNILGLWQNLDFRKNLTEEDLTYIRCQSLPHRTSFTKKISNNHDLHIHIQPNELILYQFIPYFQEEDYVL